jgi:hypothetical protein
MKRHGRPSWTWKVAPPRLTQIALAVESGRETAREMFVRLDLQRFTCYATFRRYVSQQRRLNAGRASSAPPVGRSQASAAEAGDAPRFRGRWGSRGIQRLRKLGLAALGAPEASAVAWASLLDAADSLRIIADKLADIARRLGPCHSGRSATRSDRATDGHSGADHEEGNTGTPGDDDSRRSADGDDNTSGVARAGSQSTGMRG